MTIVIESLRSGETNNINTVKEGAEFVRTVNRENVRLLCDLYHFTSENESFSEIVENADILKHFHIAAPEYRIYPSMNDKYDYMPFVSSLKNIGYTGLISIEGRYHDSDKEAIESIKFLKKLFS